MLTTLSPFGIYAKSEASITSLLDAAERRFVAQRYETVTMIDVAELAGLTKGAIYHHFKNKDHLFLSMMFRYLATLQTRLQQAVDPAASARDQLMQLTLSFLTQSLDQQRVMQLVRRDSNHFASGDRKRLIQAYQAALPLQIERVIRHGIDSRELRAGNAQLLARQFVAVVEVGLSSFARETLGTPAAMTQSLITLFLNGASQVENQKNCQ